MDAARNTSLLRVLCHPDFTTLIAAPSVAKGTVLKHWMGSRAPVQPVLFTIESKNFCWRVMSGDTWGEPDS